MSELELKFNFLHGATLQFRYHTTVAWLFEDISQAGGGYDDHDGGGECYNRAGEAPRGGLALPPSLTVSQQFLAFSLPGPGGAGGGERWGGLEVVQGLAPHNKHSVSKQSSLPPSLPQQHLRHGESVELEGTDTEVLRKQLVCLCREILRKWVFWICPTNLVISQQREENTEQGTGAGNVILQRHELLCLRNNECLGRIIQWKIISFLRRRYEPCNRSRQE